MTRPSPSLIISCLALFVALSGTAVALQANSVGSKELKRNAVKAKHVKRNTLRSNDLRDGRAVRGVDVVDGSLSGDDVANGSLGGNEIGDGSLSGADLADESITGEQIADGTLGGGDLDANSVASGELVDGQVRGADLGALNVRTNVQAVPANSSGGAFVNCVVGERRISGGVVVPAGNNRGLQSSWPNGSNGWSNVIRNNGGAPIDVTAYVLCLTG